MCIRDRCYEYGWTLEKNPEQFGQGILAGHLIECGPQSTGGTFADPPYKKAIDLAHMGFPIVEFDESGRFVITKPEGTGGEVTKDTVKEQVLYEIHDPKAYLTPDAIADFSQTHLTQVGKDRVMVEGATSHGRPEKLKVNLCYKDSFTCEGGVTSVSYTHLDVYKRQSVFRWFQALMIQRRILRLRPVWRRK